MRHTLSSVTQVIRIGKWEGGEEETKRTRMIHQMVVQLDLRAVLKHRLERGLGAGSRLVARHARYLGGVEHRVRVLCVSRQI